MRRKEDKLEPLGTSWNLSLSLPTSKFSDAHNLPGEASNLHYEGKRTLAQESEREAQKDHADRVGVDQAAASWLHSGLAS